MKNCFCGGSVSRSQYFDQFFNLPLLVCDICGTLLIDRIPSFDQIRLYYTRLYSSKRQSFVTEGYFSIMRRRADAQIEFLKRHLRIGESKVLDYGCGYGQLLDILRSAGATTYGYDYDPLCVKALVDKKHNMVLSDVFNHCDDRVWDVVCLSHVIEHLAEPDVFLENIQRRSRFVFIEVPKYDVQIQEQFVDQEGHLWFFTEQGLVALIERSGLIIQELITVGPSLRLFWSGLWSARCTRYILRWFTGDWFFNQYEKKGQERLWIRVIAKGEM